MNFNVFTKKGSSKAIVISVVCLVVLFVGVLAMVIRDRGKIPSQQESSAEKIKQQFDLSSISKEQSEQTKQELEQVVSQKQHSSDITIPPDASEEQKQQLKEKKTELKINEGIEEVYSSFFQSSNQDNATEGSSTILEVKNIFADGKYREVKAQIETVDFVDGKYVKLQKLISFNLRDNSVEDFSQQQLLSYITSCDRFSTYIVGGMNTQYDALATKIFDDCRERMGYQDECDIVMIEVSTNPETNKQGQVKYLVKLNDSYRYVTISFRDLANSVDNLEEYIQTHNISEDVKIQKTLYTVLYSSESSQAQFAPAGS